MRSLSHRVRIAAIIVLITGIFILDLATPVGFVAWMLYLLPIFLAAGTLEKPHVYLVTSVCTILTFVGLLLSPPGVAMKYGIMNCVLGVLVFWLSTLYYVRHVQMKSMLRTTEETYRLLVHNIPTGIFNYGLDLRITDCNDSFVDILQSSREQVIGLDMRRLEDQHVVPALEEPIKGNDGIYEGYYRATTSKAKIYVRVRTAPLLDQHGTIKGCVGIVEDISEQRKMKENVEEQRKFTENMIDNAATAIFVIDNNHKVVIWNKACAELTGVPSSEMVGTDKQWTPFYEKKRPTLADLVIDGDYDRLPALYTVYTKSPLSTKAIHAEGWRAHLNGRDRYILFDAAPLFNSQGELIAAIQTLQDITGRKNIEEELSRNFETQAVINSLLRLSLEHVPLEDVLSRALDLILSIPWLMVQARGGIFLIEDDSGNLTLKAHRNLNEFLQQACHHVPLGKCMCGRAALSQSIEFADSVDPRHEIRYDGITPHGHYCVPIIYAGKVLGVLNVYVDEGHVSNERERELLLAIANTLAGIIVRRKAEESLQESEVKLKAITDAAADSIILIDDEERIIYWNASASTMLGYQPEEVMGKKILFLIPPRYLDAHTQAFGKFAVTGQGSLMGKTYEVHALRKDGSEIPVELAISGIRIKDKWHAVGILRDISERKRLETQLLQAQKMEAIGQLAGGIAHDFNNILTAVIGYGSILMMKMEEQDKLRDNVAHLLDAANRGAYLTHSLLAFSRKQILNPRPTDLNEIIRRVEKLLGRIIGEDIELKTIFIQEPLTVNADGGQIEQALMNLATNARDAMPHGGTLTIQTDIVQLDDSFIRAFGYGEVGKYAVVLVSDTGIGMDDITRGHIFEPFYTTKEPGKGTGLGLSMVYGIIKQHQGFINAYSEPGKGATFKLYLPLITREKAPGTADERIYKDDLRGGTETILIAEDDEVIRPLFRTLLQEFGYTVIEAVNGADAVSKFMRNKDTIKLVILDMIMPKKGGIEAYEEIVKTQPLVKVLFMSGYTANVKSAEELVRKGVEFLLKPVSPKELLTRIRAALDV